MADYQITLAFGSTVIFIPVLPEKLAVKSPGKNETAVVLELGEINRIKQKGLREVSWESFFPAHSAPYVVDRVTRVDAALYVQEIEVARDTMESGRLSITGSNLNINMAVAVEDFNYEERGGEVGDIYYSIKLKEWKDYSAVTVSLPKPKKAVKSTPKRSGKPAAAKTHTVVKGDCLWAIAQKYYGDGSKYPQLYQKNKSTIDAKNKGTGNPKYTIYSGTVLKL